ncbi:UNVERIFIED_CONTAM: hypothetical protein HDU68_002272 [Siphonaria sp. JEL0065]|nr:hypothetical protein HDU68_002272 [Siphonaria sp. JEL0065]
MPFSEIKLSNDTVANVGSSFPECQPISATRICAPWSNGLYINTTALAHLYPHANVTSASAWETAMQADTLNPAKEFGCDNKHPKPVPFITTYICLRDIFYVSAGCNDAMKARTPSPAMCSDTCTAITGSFKAYFSDEKVCPPVASNSTAAIQRADVLDSADCKIMVKSWEQDIGANSATCLDSVSVDHDTCGFGGNKDAAANYCHIFGYNPACCAPFGKPKSGKAVINNATDANLESNEQPSGIDGATIAGIVMSVVIVLGLIVAVGFRVLKRAKKTRRPAPKSDSPYGIATTKGFYKTEAEQQRLISRRPTVLDAINRSRGPSIASSPSSGTSFINHSKPPSPLLTEESGSEYEFVKTSPLAIGEIYKVVEEYVKNKPDELSVRVDDSILLMQLHDDGWVEGRLMSTGVEGIFPQLCIDSTYGTKSA